jgi:negative modulator of initiation of replication
MKKIEVTDDVYAALRNLTTDFHQTPNDVLAALLKVGAAPAAGDDPLVGFLLGPEFRAKFTDADKYLAILAWVASRHAAEFKEYILSLSGSTSGRRYLGMSRDEIVDQCRHNQARPIPSTRYWAIMNIDTATKRRFLSRVLEFIGYREDIVDLACNVIGTRHPPRMTSKPSPGIQS